MDHQRIALLIETHRNRPGALLPLLHAIQDEAGYIPKEYISDIARALNLSDAEVQGTISFYHYFRDHPGTTVQICCAEACQSMGGEKLFAHAERTLAGRCEVEAVYCLGLCANSPSIMIGNEPHARVTPEKFDVLTAKLGEKS